MALIPHDIRMRVIVLPPDHALLQAKADALADNIAVDGGSDLSTRETELFSMPAGDASTAWQAVAKTRKYDIYQLGNYPSPQAADIVAAIIDQKYDATPLTNSNDTHQQAVQTLSYMYDLAEPGSPTQAYIKKLVDQRHLELLPIDDFLFFYD